MCGTAQHSGAHVRVCVFMCGGLVQSTETRTYAGTNRDGDDNNDNDEMKSTAKHEIVGISYLEMCFSSKRYSNEIADLRVDTQRARVKRMFHSIV